MKRNKISGSQPSTAQMNTQVLIGEVPGVFAADVGMSLDLLPLSLPLQADGEEERREVVNRVIVSCLQLFLFV